MYCRIEKLAECYCKAVTNLKEKERQCHFLKESIRIKDAEIEALKTRLEEEAGYRGDHEIFSVDDTPDEPLDQELHQKANLLDLKLHDVEYELESLKKNLKNLA